MKTKEATIEYFIPQSSSQRGYLYGPLFSLMGEVLGVNDEVLHKRMRDKLKGWGWIKESRRELDYFEMAACINMVKKFLKRKEICIE